MNRSLFLHSAAVLGFSALLTSCGISCAPSSSSPSNLPVLRIGAESFPPFAYEDADGNHVGIDVEIAQEALARIGYQPQFCFIDWDNKNTLLESHEIDCLWNCFSMAGRETDYLWAGPYMLSRQVIVVNEDSDFYTLHDLDGKVIAVRSTALPETLLQDADDPRYPVNCSIYSLDDSDLLYAALSKGYVDAMAAHEAAVYQYMQDYGAVFRILDEPLIETGVGVAFLPSDSRGIAEQLDQVLTEMRTDGTLEAILCKYFSNPEIFLEVERLE